MAEPLRDIDQGFMVMVFNHLTKESSRDGRDAHMNVGEAEKELGISQAQILRAISGIRSQGYPVLAKATRRTWENDFRIPQTQKEYIEWRSKLVEDLKELQTTLLTSDAAAKAKFGADMPVEQFLF